MVITLVDFAIRIEFEIQDSQLSFVHQFQNTPSSSTLHWFFPNCQIQKHYMAFRGQYYRWVNNS
jgi:hypothetical protein